MKVMKSATVVVIAAAVLGCAGLNSQSRFVDPASRPDLASFVTSSDISARAVLAEYNSSEYAKTDEYAPYRIEEYDRLLSESVTRWGCTNVTVFYDLRRPVGFLGHPRHFAIVIDKGTGEVQIHGGQ